MMSDYCHFCERDIRDYTDPVEDSEYSYCDEDCLKRYATTQWVFNKLDRMVEEILPLFVRKVS